MTIRKGSDIIAGCLNNNLEVVHKSGTETITGNKILAFNPLITNDNTLQVRFPNAGLPNRDVITEKNNLWSLIFCDNNVDSYDISQDLSPDHRIGLIETVNIKEQSNNYILMRAYKPGSSTGEAIQIAVGYNTNKAYTTAPACDSTNSIVTTTGINKNTNGYVKFGNGIIIQWGTVVSDNQVITVTYSTPFINMQMPLVIFGDAVNYQQYVSVRKDYNDHTGFTINRSASGTARFNYISIGY